MTVKFGIAHMVCVTGLSGLHRYLARAVEACALAADIAVLTARFAELGDFVATVGKALITGKTWICRVARFAVVFGGGDAAAVRTGTVNTVGIVGDT